MHPFIKTLLLSIIIVSAFSMASAQTWKDMLNDPSVNVYDVVAEAERYFENIDKEAKGSGWKKYQRWLWETEPKFYPSGDRSSVDPYFVANSYQDFLKNNNVDSRSIFDNGWEELGPYYIETVTGHYSCGLGRVETFYIDPNDSLRMYLGSRSGGFWRTDDGGATWEGSTTDFLAASGVNTMTASPTNADSILINVRNARNGASHGVYRSIDGGATWTLTAFNPANLGWGGLGTNTQIYQIEYHPTIPDLIIIGTSTGVFRSDDNLATWTEPITSSNYRALAFHPTDPNVIYAASSNTNHAISISRDGGLTFQVSGDITGNSATIRLSTTAACPSCVYVGTSDGIWKSSDEGENFGMLSQPGISNYGAFAVNDVDNNYMLFGDIDTHISSNEGGSFNKATIWSQGNANYKNTGTYVHADIRGSRSIDGVFWVNTDGFLGKSEDFGQTWEIYEGQSIRENYSLGVSQSNHDRTICGSQDNGTSINTETSWVEFYGADGMEGIIHPLNDDWMIGSLQYGGRRRTQDGGITQRGVTPNNDQGAWIAPLFYDPNDHMRVYDIRDRVYRSDDFGTSWTELGGPSFSGSITYATIAENNSQAIVVVRGENIELSLDGGENFSSIKGNLPGNSITDVVFDPNDDNTIIVTYGTYQNNGNKVFITRDQGATWENITANLSNMPVRCAVVDHTDASTIYLGTEIGVYKKSMDEDTWTLYSNDLPNMSVLELEVMYGSNTLRAATWGRGLWEYSLDGRQNYPAILTTRTTDLPTELAPIAGVDQFVTSTIAYDSTLSSVYVEWSRDSATFANAIPMSNASGTTWTSDMPLPNFAEDTRLFFRVVAVGAEADTSMTYKFMYTLREFRPCLSLGNLAYQTAVTLVDFNGIQNATGKTLPYNDYTDTDSAVVAVGSTYPITVNLNTDGDYTITSNVWIDWNRDADFDDPGESYNMGTTTNSEDGATTNSPLEIEIPGHATPGRTFMRVSAKYVSLPGPCEINFDGEVEDYRIVIEKGFIEQMVDTSICFADSIFLEGAFQTTPGTYRDTVPYTAGADLIYITELTMYDELALTDYQLACDSLIWIDGNTYYSDNDTAQYRIVNSAACDSVITLNLQIVGTTYGATDVSSCGPYTVPSGSATYSVSGTYADTITNFAGCDSILTIQLTIVEIDTTVTVSAPTLTSNADSASYQWIDCETGNSITGANDQSFTAAVSGSYQVLILQDGCVDTSACYQITGTHTLENSFGGDLKVYPNPTTRTVLVDLGDSYARVQSKVFSNNGQLLNSAIQHGAQTVSIDIEGPSGVYIIELEASGDKRAVVRVVKE